MDRLNQPCEYCKEGTYQELSVTDGVYGFLHCDKCGKRVRWHEDEPPPADAKPAQLVAGFMARAFICEQCGTRIYYDIIQMDPEFCSRSVRDLRKDVADELKRMRARNPRLNLELTAFTEPQLILCPICNTTFAVV